MSENKNITLGGGNRQDDNLEEMSRRIAMQEAQNATNNSNKMISPSLDEEFMVPTDEVPLPSEGKFYPTGQKTVKIKYLTAEDENILTSSELIRNGKVLDVLLENSVIDSTIKPSEMLTGDRNAVLLALRSTGYGDEYEVKMTCDNCGEDYKTNVLLSSLKQRPLDIDPDSNGEFEVNLPKMKIPVKFRLMTGADEAKLTKIAASSAGKKKINNSVSVSTLLTERYLLQVMEVNGNRDKLYIKKAITRMPISDSLFLREYMKLVEPGINMNHEFGCPFCSHNQEKEVPITAKLFWPNAQID